MTTEEERLLPDREMEARVYNVTDVLQVLQQRVSFAKSCIDMGWKWEVREVFFEDGSGSTPGAGGATRIWTTDAGFLIRTSFRRPDRETGVVNEGMGGWHHVPPNATVSAVVKRAYVAVDAILRHELMEAFKVDGARPFDPHSTVAELLSIQGARTVAKYVKGIDERARGR